ncbi:MAG: CoA-binding protein [Planctomycetaceae bacterium]|nr:CoA-binding protein [Planctomycetaceae bacterium]
MSQPITVILGASADRSKYGNKSVRAHVQAGYEVYPINPKAEKIEGLQAYASIADLPTHEVDRVSVYLPPAIGMQMIEEIAGLSTGEVWFNPGSESPELLARAHALGLNVVQACSIVDLGLSPSQFPA